LVVLAITSSLVTLPSAAIEKGPDPTAASIAANGPYATSSTTIPTPAPGFGGGVIHYPIGAPGETFGAVAVAPGFLASSANYAWMGPYLASHGFVVVQIDTL